MKQQQRHYCRNQRCRTKLSVPTDNEHKAFCSRYCFDQFYSWRCKVCEQPIQKGKRRRQPDHCHAKQCRTDFRRYPETFGYYPSQTINYDERSARFTGVKTALNSPPSYSVIAGPQLSDLLLWAATLDSTKPGLTFCQLAELTRRERERDEADARYVAEDEAQLAEASQ